VFFLCSRTGSNQAFCLSKKWFGVAKFARRNAFREQTSGEGRSPLSKSPEPAIIPVRTLTTPKCAFELKRSERDFFDIISRC